MTPNAPILDAIPLPELSKIVSQLRASGKRIVFTNGVFDLIHPGHVRYLRTAKSFGDVLIVALNSDASVRRLKGDLRPILSQAERVKIIASLEMADYVTLFDDDTPLCVIETLLPDVLVKGGDYAIGEIVGREAVEKSGGVVRTVPLVEGASSSNIVQRIIESVQK